MESLPLSFGVVLGYLQQTIAGIEDPRQASNGTALARASFKTSSPSPSISCSTVGSI